MAVFVCWFKFNIRIKVTSVQSNFRESISVDLPNVERNLFRYPLPNGNA